MGNSKSLLTQSLKRVKEKHGLTIETWAEKSNVPESTVARYLSSSLNIPNFPYVCAMLKAVGESIDTFYDTLDKKIDAPSAPSSSPSVPLDPQLPPCEMFSVSSWKVSPMMPLSYIPHTGPSLTPLQY